jgi:hypothetical protein
MKKYKQGENSRRVTAHVDRHANTVLSGYSDNQLIEISDKFLIECKHHSMRNRLDFLLGHYIVGRGENKRVATLPDLGLVDCPFPGAQRHKAVILIMNQGRFYFFNYRKNI